MKTIFKQFTKLKTWCACRNLLPSPLLCASQQIYIYIHQNEWNNYRKYARFSFQPEKFFFFFWKINTCVRAMNKWYVDRVQGDSLVETGERHRHMSLQDVINNTCQPLWTWEFYFQNIYSFKEHKKVIH